MSDPILLNVDPEKSPLYQLLGHFPKKEVEHWWDEDKLERILPVDIAFQAVYGHRAWLDWLELGRPDKFTIVWKTDSAAEEPTA